LPWRWKLALDPLVMNRGREIHTGDPAWLNQLVITYETDLIVNRVVMILLTAICLTLLYLLFTTTERSDQEVKLTVLSLSTAAEGVYYQESLPAEPTGEFERADYGAGLLMSRVEVPVVTRVNEGIRADVNKLVSALAVEFRLLLAERSLVVVMPLAIFLSIFEVAFYNLTPDVSHSAAYATNTAKLSLLFLIGIAVFYTGEAMHRDRELRIEPMLWATPVPNNVLLLSKFLATFLLLAGLIVAVGFAAIAIQILRGHAPIDLLAYLRVYGIILLPGCVFLTALSLLLNVILRNKHVAYVVSVGTAAGLFYLHSIGYKHWLYNPMFYRLWTYADLTSPGPLRMIVFLRMYFVAIAIVCLALAYLFFERKSTARLVTRIRQPRSQLPPV